MIIILNSFNFFHWQLNLNMSTYTLLSPGRPFRYRWVQSIILFILSSLLITLTCCTAGKKTNDQLTAGVILSNDNFNCQYNSDSTFLMCVSKISHPEGKEFIVIKQKVDSVVFKENLQDPLVNWLSKNEIEIDRGLGFKGEDNGREISILSLITMERKVISTVSITKWKKNYVNS